MSKNQKKNPFKRFYTSGKLKIDSVTSRDSHKLNQIAWS